MDSVTMSERPQPLAPPFTPTVPAMLHRIAELYGDQEAQVSPKSRITFRDLERRSAVLARGLLAQGVTKGSRVAVLMPNGPEFTLAFMAAARIGAIVAPLSTLYQAPELRWVLNHADIQVLMIADRYLRHDYVGRLEEALPSLSGQTAGRLVLPEAPYLRSILVWGDCDRAWAAAGPDALEAAAAVRPEMDDAFLAAVEANVAPADLLCIIHTSGSTAEPKGVVHSHGVVIRHSWQKAQRYWAMEESERVIVLRPFFWVAGLAASVFQCLLKGCCLIVPEDNSGATVLRLIEAEGATAINSSDEGWLRGLRSDPVLQAAGYDVMRQSNDCAAVARRTEAGARLLHPARAERKPAPTHLPDELFARTYGMTETLSAHTSVPSGETLPPDRPRHCGRPIPGVMLKIVDPQTRETLGPGQVGEVLVGGYSMMQGLYKKDRQDVFTQDGYYPTGDLASLDEEGWLKFNSRMGEMIKVHGANVAPLEVELNLNTLAGVERSAVVGVPAGEGVMLVAAAQVREPKGFDEAAAREQLRRLLSSFKVPKRIIAMAPEEFPVTGSGKIRKSELAVLLADRLRAEGG